MQTEATIGILGGMGPEATLDCFGKVLAHTPAGCDQEHLKIVIYNNPKVPDRTRAILEQGASPLPALVRGAAALKQAGADFVIIPCVTAHFFLESLRAESELPILSILDAVAQQIKKSQPQAETIGLLGTSGTVQSGIFQKKLAQEGMAALTCDEPMQQQVMEAIYEIKNKHTPLSPAEITGKLAKAAEYLIQRGAQGIIAGCTEIPLALSQKDMPAPYFDSLSILARAAIRRAGREPV